jgi:hypothetical protein
MNISNALWVLLSFAPVLQAEQPAAVLESRSEVSQSVLADDLNGGSAEAGSAQFCEPPPCQRLYFGAEYVLWWLREGRLPPILTTGSPASAGVLGAADTRVLYGDDRLETRHGDRFNGVRLTLGYWLTDGPLLGIEGEVFVLERDSTHFKATSDGSELLALPYTNAATGLPASAIIAGPSPDGVLRGGFVGYSRIELFGQQVNMVGVLANGAAGRLDLLAGARFLEMRDRLDLTSASYILPAQTTLLSFADNYRVHNVFYGAQAGLRGTLYRGPWSLQWRGLMALGGDDQTVRTFAADIVQTPLTRSQLNTGLYVQDSNLGTFRRGAFDMVYETGINLGFQLTQRIQVFGGYTFLCWVNPIRTGDQVDTTLNLTGSGPVRPVIPFRENSFWAQGLNAGVMLRW